MDSIAVTEKSEGDITINFKVVTQVEYKSKLGQKSYQQVYADAAINVFRDVDDANLVMEVNYIYSDLFNIDKANEYSILSNSGNLETTAKSIEENESLIETIKADINRLETKIKKVDPRGKIKLQIEEVNIKTSIDAIEDASRGATISNINPFSGSEADLLLAKALVDEKDGFNDAEFVENITGNNSEYISNPIADDIWGTQLKKALEDDKYKSISSVINQYNLEANYQSKSNLKRMLDKQGSTFALDMEKDKTVIAIFGTKIRNAKFTLNNQEFDFPSFTVVVRQKTTYPSTYMLYNKFVEDAYRYQKAMFNIKKTNDPTNSTNRQTNIKIYQPISNITSANNYVGSVIQNQMLNYNADALEHTKALRLSSSLYTSSGKSFIEYIVINKNGNAFFYNLSGSDPKDRTNLAEFRTYFFSSGLTNHDKCSFSFGPYGQFIQNQYLPKKSLSTAEINQHEFYNSHIKVIN